MDKRQGLGLAHYIPVLVLLWGTAVFGAEIVPRLTTERSEYELGEPVVLRQWLDTSHLRPDELEMARDRSDEKVLLVKDGGKQFPPLPTGLTSSRSKRPKFGDMIEAFIFLQPLSFWDGRPSEPLPDWASELLGPGKYTVHVEQNVSTSAGATTLRSNDVAFVVRQPSGRSLAAWNELTSNPALLSVGGKGPSFPSVSSLNQGGLEKTADFGQRYIDTPQGQFAAILCAFNGLTQDRLDVAADLYPSLGRLLDLRLQEDFVTWYGRFCYLATENLLEERFNPQSGLSTMRQFDTSLSSAPLELRQQVRKLIGEYQDLIARSEQPPFERIDPLVGRLTQRGALPTDAVTRTRRHNLALGKTGQ